MNILPFIENKIINNCPELDPALSLWRFKNEKIVFTNGCFDIVHRGHVEYLIKAAALGTKLIIGLNSDTSVKKLKSVNRPINDEQSRALLLASFIFVDKVILFETDTPIDLIRHIQPDILVKGGDYKPENIIGYDIVKAKGGDVVAIDFIDGFSSTAILDKI